MITKVCECKIPITAYCQLCGGLVRKQSRVVISMRNSKVNNIKYLPIIIALMIAETIGFW